MNFLKGRGSHIGKEFMFPNYTLFLKSQHGTILISTLALLMMVICVTLLGVALLTKTRNMNVSVEKQKILNSIRKRVCWEVICDLFEGHQLVPCLYIGCLHVMMDIKGIKIRCT